MGLAIVRQVARWHGGDACIADSPLGGARITIAW
jgi:signal transduction histidine kinase